MKAAAEGLEPEKVEPVKKPEQEPEVVIQAEGEDPKPEEEKKFDLTKKSKGPRPKGTKRFKKVVMEEPERPEEELSEH